MAVEARILDVDDHALHLVVVRSGSEVDEWRLTVPRSVAPSPTPWQTGMAVRLSADADQPSGLSLVPCEPSPPTPAAIQIHAELQALFARF